MAAGGVGLGEALAPAGMGEDAGDGGGQEIAVLVAGGRVEDAGRFSDGELVVEALAADAVAGADLLTELGGGEDGKFGAAAGHGGQLMLMAPSTSRSRESPAMVRE